MKFIVAFACFVAVAAAAAIEDTQVLSRVQDVGPESYNYAYALANGAEAQESGSLKGENSIAVQGGYKFVSPEGVQVELSYIADENGYQPSGPFVPEIPEAIVRSLAYLATAKPYVEKLERQRV